MTHPIYYSPADIVQGLEPVLLLFSAGCLGQQAIVDLVQHDTTYYVFENGHELPLLCFCSGEPMEFEDPEWSRNHMRGRRLKGMLIRKIEL